MKLGLDDPFEYIKAHRLANILGLLACLAFGFLLLFATGLLALVLLGCLIAAIGIDTQILNAIKNNQNIRPHLIKQIAVGTAASLIITFAAYQYPDLGCLCDTGITGLRIGSTALAFAISALILVVPGIVLLRHTKLPLANSSPKNT
ncbi:MAG TPA: hypothetical protein VMT30_01795 [Candidatus Saccharimonadia bacterium]|nr:hypothetical protein [Candidatus Saccharimonadia bacterium]